MNLNNTATAVGTYNGISTSLTSNVSVVNMISGLSMTKSVDKVNWADGYLTYTVTINNQSTETYVAPVITDIIDTTLVDFVDGSVMIDGIAATGSQYSYASETHTLSITLTDIASSTTKTVTFQVSKKA